MSAATPSTTAPCVDTSEWPESYVRNGYAEQRGGDDILFTITPEGHYLATLNGYAVIPIEKYFALINEPLPERIAQALGL
jgi:beta-glucosidase-like glycosyl hydrolase